MAFTGILVLSRIPEHTLFQILSAIGRQVWGAIISACKVSYSPAESSAQDTGAGRDLRTGRLV